jgi:hypothetical protein
MVLYYNLHSAELRTWWGNQHKTIPSHAKFCYRDFKQYNVIGLHEKSRFLFILKMRCLTVDYRIFVKDWLIAPKGKIDLKIIYLDDYNLVLNVNKNIVHTFHWQFIGEQTAGKILFLRFVNKFIAWFF